VIAKIAGIGSDGADANGVSGELLQISADEQRRAGRSAALFGEEELTRFLQVMLRTFDELGYRQEQRFHFELGLLKLVHLRRLLPVEEVLSQFPVGGSSAQPRTQSTTAQARVAAPSPVANRVMSAPVLPVSAKPAFSPFEVDKSRKRFESSDTEKPVAAAPAPARVPLAPRPLEPALAAAKPLEVAAIPIAAPPVKEVSLPVKEVAPSPVVEAAPEQPRIEASSVDILASIEVPEARSPQASQEAAELQRVATEALTTAKSQGSAADALADAEWTIEGSELRVQTELSKTMLPMVVNAEAEKIVRAALRETGSGALKLVLLPGAAKAAAAKKPRAAKSGSAQAKAMEHPVVQQAQKLFDAEIRNVIDLREGD
jgi:DNA polymerase III subunit gamma/tau